MIPVLGNAKGGDIMDSILNNVKKLLGIDSEDDSFDIDVMTMINSTIPSLAQIGIGPSNGYIVTSADDKWTDWITTNDINLQGVKTYLYLKIKLIFDPPTNSTVVEAFNKNLNELEWRMMLAVETNNLEV